MVTIGLLAFHALEASRIQRYIIVELHYIYLQASRTEYKLEFVIVGAADCFTC